MKYQLMRFALLSASLGFSLAALAQEETDVATIHENLTVLDSHLDTPMLLVRPEFDINRRNSVSVDFSQVDLPRMKEGKLDGGFWVIYTPQGPLDDASLVNAREQAILRAFAIHKMVHQNQQDFAFATLASEVEGIVDDGKRVVFISMENAYPLGNDLTLLPLFYELGLRMLGPVHFANNQFGDSSTDPKGTKWNGLSPLGEDLVKEANRLGILLDGSHASDELVKQMITLSKAPIILSHSGTKSVYDHPRNIDDELLDMLIESGGVIQMNAYSSYLTELAPTPERDKAFADVFTQIGPFSQLDEEGLSKFMQMRREIDAKYPASKASFEDYMAHFLYILDRVGPKHVGVGADWDGGGGVEGMMDVSELEMITARLLKEGYTTEQLEDIWSGNMLRILEQARIVAQDIAQKV